MMMELNKALNDLAPEMDPTGVAAAVRRRRARRHAVIGGVSGVCALALVIGGVLMQQNRYATPAPAGPATSQVSHPVAPNDGVTQQASGLVAGQVTLLQAPGDDHPMLCNQLLASYPPQCMGPRVLGEVNWAELGAEEASGTRWVHEAWVIGTFDSTKGELTLSAPASLQAPAGVREVMPSEAPGYHELPEDLEKRFDAARSALEPLYRATGPIAQVEDYSSPGRLTIVLWAPDPAVEKQVRELIGQHLSADEYGFDSLLTLVG